METLFNVAGPCFPADHYMLPALDRLPQIRRLVNQETYFVIHAPRQTGKTTAVKALALEINATGEMIALYCTRDREDYRFVIDLGLMRENELHELVPSNRMYAEIIGRYLTRDTQDDMVKSVPKTPWALPDGLTCPGSWRRSSRSGVRTAASSAISKCGRGR